MSGLLNIKISSQFPYYICYNPILLQAQALLPCRLLWYGSAGSPPGPPPLLLSRLSGQNDTPPDHWSVT